LVCSGEFGNDIENGTDFLGLLSELQHVRDDLVDLASDAGDRFVGHIDGAVAGARRARRLFGVLGHALCALGDLARGCPAARSSWRDLGHGRRLLPGTGGLRLAAACNSLDEL